ncbi:DUF7139 domain-containing protein [Halovivax cerinus]|uniref:Uncharacterized protein n=1 Tax=Halovivax cerinus TaxID=1487865 RepID=A0ABD5NMX8_9EURY|nr:hypothetical protein [Halovivax cerinus]
MTSLTEAYNGNKREVTSTRRLYTGTGLVLAGGVLAVLAILVATTDHLSFVASGTLPSREVAGTLGGLAVPVVLVGVFTVLPASLLAQVAAAISATICLVGVVLFRHAYPKHWAGHGQDLTFFVSLVYLVGLFSAILCLFVVVVNFKMRNDPGGALEMNVTRQGRTKVVEVERDTGGVSGVGFLGATPDGDVETQTNAQSDGSRNGTDRISSAVSDAASSVASTATRSASGRASGSATGRPTPTSDGGVESTDITSPLDDTGRVDRTTPAEPADHYCGNCRHFEYRRGSSGMVPYCTHHGERMDDMDPCEQWTANR